MTKLTEKQMENLRQFAEELDTTEDIGGYDDDDRFDRWCEVNGIVSIRFQTLDGKHIMRYFRADGSEVVVENSYGYDEAFTPYTPTSGKA